MKQWIASKLENAVNRYLALDDESKHRLQLLENKRVTIELLGMGLSFQLGFMDEKIHFKYENFDKSDTYIKGTPLTLLRMAMTSGDRKQFFSDDATIEGNLDLGQAVIDLFDHLDIDWEEYLSIWMGDVSAHQLGRVASQIKTFSRKTRATILQNINEYAHEEINLFPSREALMDFYADVDELRMDVDRIEAKIKLIKKNMDVKRGIE